MPKRAESISGSAALPTHMNSPIPFSTRNIPSDDNLCILRTWLVLNQDDLQQGAADIFIEASTVFVGCRLFCEGVKRGELRTATKEHKMIVAYTKAPTPSAVISPLRNECSVNTSCECHISNLLPPHAAEYTPSALPFGREIGDAGKLDEVPPRLRHAVVVVQPVSRRQASVFRHVVQAATQDAACVCSRSMVRRPQNGAIASYSYK